MLARSKMAHMKEFERFTHVYTPSIHADGYIVSYFRSSVRSYFSYVKVWVGVNLSNHSSEIIHIWTIVTLEGWHSHHDFRPQGPCPWVGLKVKI